MIIPWQNIVYWVTCARRCPSVTAVVRFDAAPPERRSVARRPPCVSLPYRRLVAVAERIAAFAGDFSRYARRTRWTCKRAGNHDSGPRPQVSQIICQYPNHIGYRNYICSVAFCFLIRQYRFKKKNGLFLSPKSRFESGLIATVNQ